MQRFVWVVLALILSTLVQARDAYTEQRIALVIGNGAYGKVPRLPKQDPYATALAAELVKPDRNDPLMFHNVGAWDTETLTSHSKCMTGAVRFR